VAAAAQMRDESEQHYQQGSDAYRDVWRLGQLEQVE
jgi:hypothetical protein